MAKITHRRQRGGSTLVEVTIALIVGLVPVLGLFPLFGVIRANGLRGAAELQALSAVQGRLDELTADLSLFEQSPLQAALPKDFLLRYVTASPPPSKQWSLSTSTTVENMTPPALGAYRMETTAQYIDDSTDGVSPTDTDPYDALILRVRIVPATVGAANIYETVLLETLWYR